MVTLEAPTCAVVRPPSIGEHDVRQVKTVSGHVIRVERGVDAQRLGARRSGQHQRALARAAVVVLRERRRLARPLEVPVVADAEVVGAQVDVEAVRGSGSCNANRFLRVSRFSV